MKYNIIQGCEINPEFTSEYTGNIWINEGIFKGPGVTYTFNSIVIPVICSKTPENDTRVNVYYNPDNNKYTTVNDIFESPHQVYGYFLGGVTLKRNQDNGSCIDKILVPIDSGDCAYVRLFAEAYSNAYMNEYHSLLPDGRFGDGYGPGYDDIVSPKPIC